jgi:hypothetical protein
MHWMMMLQYQLQQQTLAAWCWDELPAQQHPFLSVKSPHAHFLSWCAALAHACCAPCLPYLRTGWDIKTVLRSLVSLLRIHSCTAAAQLKSHQLRAASACCLYA